MLEVRKHVEASLETKSSIAQLRISGPNKNPDYYEDTLVIRAELTERVTGTRPRKILSAVYELKFDMTDNDNPEWTESQIISSFVEVIPVSEVRHLIFGLPEQNVSPDLYSRWFSSMKNLTHLEISSQSGAAIPLVIKQDISGPSTTPPILPKLMFLGLLDYDFRPKFGTRFIELLCIALERRARKGFKLYCLAFHDCFFAGTDWIPRARACVYELWDQEDVIVEGYKHFYKMKGSIYDGA